MAKPKLKLVSPATSLPQHGRLPVVPDPRGWPEARLGPLMGFARS
jgi:hypothetical protein